jgi:hypothetical protein
MVDGETQNNKGSAATYLLAPLAPRPWRRVRVLEDLLGVQAFAVHVLAGALYLQTALGLALDFDASGELVLHQAMGRLPVYAFELTRAGTFGASERV